MKAPALLIFAAVVIATGTLLAVTSEKPKAQPHTVGPPLFATQTQEDPQELANKSGCLKCHNVDKKLVGPAYRAVAERYKDDPGARKALFEKIKNGGKGKWTDVTGDVPMPPHAARLSKSDIERLVNWVLSLKNQ